MVTYYLQRHADGTVVVDDHVLSGYTVLDSCESASWLQACGVLRPEVARACLRRPVSRGIYASKRT